MPLVHQRPRKHGDPRTLRRYVRSGRQSCSMAWVLCSTPFVRPRRKHDRLRHIRPLVVSPTEVHYAWLAQLPDRAVLRGLRCTSHTLPRGGRDASDVACFLPHTITGARSGCITIVWELGLTSNDATTFHPAALSCCDAPPIIGDVVSGS